MKERKRIEVTDFVHKKLSIYKAENAHRNFSQSINTLLNKNKRKREHLNTKYV